VNVFALLFQDLPPVAGDVVVPAAVVAIIMGLMKLLELALKGRRTPAPVHVHSRRSDDPSSASFTADDRSMMVKIIINGEQTNFLLTAQNKLLSELVDAIRRQQEKK
jgi:hypothetical protein